MQPSQHDDIQGIQAELADLRAELDAVRRTTTPPWRRGLARVRSMRRLTVVGIAALMLAVPVAVSANHIFSDVPTSSTYHTTTARLVGAGITGGCGSGRYCPNAAVTRGQMAAFLNRGLGRMAGAESGAPDDDWANFTPEFGAATATALRAGGGGGGSAQVFATGTISAWTNQVGLCPCEVQAYLSNDTTSEVSLVQYDVIASERAPADPDVTPLVQYAETNMTVSYMFSVPSGALNDYSLVVRIVPTGTLVTTNLSGFAASIQAIYVPFDAQGANPVLPGDTQGQPPAGRGNR